MQTDETSVETINKKSPNRILLILIVVLALFVLGCTYYLYQFSGYKEYKRVNTYLNTLAGDQKTRAYNEFYGIGKISNLHGGILAASWNRGILMWGINGLTYYSLKDYGSEYITKSDTTKSDIINPSTNNNWTRLYFINGGCRESLMEIAERDQTGTQSAPFKSRFFENISSNPFIEYHLHMYKWRRVAHPGMYVQVLTNGQNNYALSVTAESEFSVPNNWVICVVVPQ